MLISPARAEDKSFISEIAQEKVGVQIVVSGDQARSVASELQSAIIAASSPKAKPPQKKDANNVIIVKAGDYRSAPLVSTTQIFLLIGNECDAPFSPALRSALPNDIGAPDTKIGVLESKITSDTKNAGAFSIVLFAPDAERLKPLQDDFLARRFGNRFRDMGEVSRRVRTNRIALFSNPKIRPDISDWGRISATFDASPPLKGPCKTNEVVDDVRWFDLAERPGLKDSDLNEAAEVYFLDRSSEPVLPVNLQAPLAGIPIKATTLLTWREQTGDGRPLIVFSAPNRNLLLGRVAPSPNLKVLAGGVQSNEAVDLRGIGGTVLLINGEAPKGEREAVRLLLAKDMRTDVGVVIEERGKEFFETLNSESALRQLQGDVKRRDAARKLARSDWIWMFTITDYSGETTYDSAEQRITPEPEPFVEAPPVEPSAHDKKSRKYQIEVNAWREAMNAWEERKQSYENRVNNADYQWRRVITSREAASVHGVLRLVNLRDQGRVEWEHECKATETQSKQFRADTTSIQGRDARPSSLDSPQSRNNCTQDVLRKAARQAGRGGLLALQAQAWLADGKGEKIEDDTPDPPSNSKNAASSPASPVANGPKVAAILGDTLILNIGTAQNVRAGDVFSVALLSTPITDPNSGQILDYKVTRRLFVRVVGGNRTAECVALTPEDKAHWSELKAGQIVTKVNSPTTKTVPPLPPKSKTAPR